jgi:hypothetical protein
MGMGKMWNPAWDKLPPGQLAMTLSEYGKELQGSGLKLRQATELQDSKNSSAEERARLAQEARLAAIDATRERTAATAEKPLNMSQLEASLRQRAIQGDQKAIDALEILQDNRVEQRTASAQIASGDKPDLDALGIKTNKGKSNSSGDKDTDMYKKAFGAYEPSKYEYRVGPNGIPQRKLKGN